MAKTKTIENLFVYLDIYSSLIPILLFILYWKKSSPQVGLRLLVVYSLLFYIINIILLKDPNNSFLYEMFTVIEFILFASFLFTQIKNRTAKNILVSISILFTIYYFIFILVSKGEGTIDSIQIGIETIIILLFSYYYLYERMNDTTTLFIYNTYPFWVVLGIVLHLSGSFFVYIFADYISDAEVTKYWVITNILSVIKSILFSIAIYINTKPIKNTLTSDFELTSLN